MVAIQHFVFEFQVPHDHDGTADSIANALIADAVAPRLVVVHLYTDRPNASHLLLEAQHRGVPIGGPYSVRHDRPHSSVGQEHLHFFDRSGELFAINKDGTAHDRSHGYQIPNRIAKAMAQQFPDFSIPKNRLIESIPDDLLALLTEAR